MIQVYSHDNTANATLVASVCSLIDTEYVNGLEEESWLMLPDNFENYQHLMNGVDAFVRPHGLEVLLVRVKDLSFRPRGYYIVIGLVPNPDNIFESVKRAVVARDGELIHDPSRVNPISDISEIIPAIYIFFIADMDKVKAAQPTQVNNRQSWIGEEFFYFDPRPGMHRIFSGVAKAIQPFVENGVTHWQISLHGRLLVAKESDLIIPEQMIAGYRRALKQKITRISSDYTTVFMSAYTFSKSPLDMDSWLELVYKNLDSEV